MANNKKFIESTCKLVQEQAYDAINQALDELKRKLIETRIRFDQLSEVVKTYQRSNK